MMQSSRQIAVLTRQLTRVWRSSTAQITSICSPGPAISVTPPLQLRPGYLTQSQGMATAQAESSSQEQSSGESSRSGPSEEAKRRARNLQIATGAACAFFGASYILYRQLSVRAAEATVVEKVCVCVCCVQNIYYSLQQQKVKNVKL